PRVVRLMLKREYRPLLYKGGQRPLQGQKLATYAIGLQLPQVTSLALKMRVGPALSNLTP
ncbi:MAG: hypothetical protein ACPH0C_05260, partial [Flavobacteriales bacterium]